MIPKILLLVEQIRPRTTQIDDFRTTVSILLQARTFEAVESIRDTLATAYDTLVLIISEGALIADAGKSGRADVAVANGTLAVTLVAEASDGDACLLAAHNQIGMMARHACK